jgi:putative lipoic acid-binding regulatory protein
MKLDEEWTRRFRERLEETYVWPALYTYKFIVKTGREEEVKNLFPMHFSTSRPSGNGNYTSLTFQMMMPSAEAVISVYKRAATVDGLIAL